MDQFAAVARQLRAQATEGATLDQAVAIAVDIIDGCDFAGVSLVDSKRKVETVGATDPVAVRGDTLQYELDEGPCLDSPRDHETVTSPDLRAEQRWPRWAAKVADELGIQSMLWPGSGPASTSRIRPPQVAVTPGTDPATTLVVTPEI